MTSLAWEKDDLSDPASPTKSDPCVSVLTDIGPGWLVAGDVAGVEGMPALSHLALSPEPTPV